MNAKTMKLEALNNGYGSRIPRLKSFSRPPNRPLPRAVRVHASVQDLRGQSVAVRPSSSSFNAFARMSQAIENF